jgi:hypothetical protein
MLQDMNIIHTKLGFCHISQQLLPRTYAIWRRGLPAATRDRVSEITMHYCLKSGGSPADTTVDRSSVLPLISSYNAADSGQDSRFEKLAMLLGGCLMLVAILALTCLRQMGQEEIV